MSHDSDIEELPSSFPASGPNALPLKSRNNGNLEASDSHLNYKYEVLRQLLPPAHVPGAPVGDEDRRNEADHDSLDQGPNFPVSTTSSPMYSPLSPSPSPSLFVHPPYVFPPTWLEDFGESSFFGYHAWESRSNSDAASSAHEEEELALFSPTSPLPSPGPLLSRAHSWSPLGDENEPSRRASPSLNRENSRSPDPQSRASRSRSTSPMDLASPSPAMAPQDLPREEPIVTMAPSPLRATSTPPPAPESKSLLSVTEEPVDVEPAASQEPSMAAAKAMSLDVICSSEPLSPVHEYQGEQPSNDKTPSKPSTAQIATDEDVQPEPAPAASGIIATTPPEESEVVALKTSLEKLQVSCSFVLFTNIDLKISIPSPPG